MFRRSAPDDEITPLLAHQRTESSRTLVADETSRKTGDREVQGADLVWILAALWSAVFLGALDGTVAATLIAPIGAYFNRSNQSSYIGTAYLLSVCCFTPLYGRLSDIIGRRGAMLVALSSFGLGTLFCGIAPTMNTLIAARAIAGMGGGGIMTASSIAVTDLVPLKKRGIYQGLASILFAAGAGLGGPLGGWLNDQFGWRSAFLFQVPILALSMMLVWTKVHIPLPEEVRSLSLQTKLKRIDWLGSLALVLAVGCLLLGLSLKSTEEFPWSHPLIWGLISAGCVWGVIFVIVEVKIVAYPVMPIRLMKQRTPLAIASSTFFASISVFSLIYNIPLYFSAVRLNSSTDAGLRLLPYSLSVSCGSLFAGWIIRWTGKLYALTLASVSLCVISSISIALWDVDVSEFRLWFDVVPYGFGVASLITATLIAMISSVAKEDMAVATGITFLFRSIGQVLGVSLSGSLLQAILTKQLRNRITGPDASDIIERIQHNAEIISGLPAHLRVAAVASYEDALRAVFICQVACNVVVFLCCLPIQENPLSDTKEEQEGFHRSRPDERDRNRGQDESSAP